MCTKLGIQPGKAKMEPEKRVLGAALGTWSGGAHLMGPWMYSQELEIKSSATPDAD